MDDDNLSWEVKSDESGHGGMSSVNLEKMKSTPYVRASIGRAKNYFQMKRYADAVHSAEVANFYVPTKEAYELLCQSYVELAIQMDSKKKGDLTISRKNAQYYARQFKNIVNLYLSQGGNAALTNEWFGKLSALEILNKTSQVDVSRQSLFRNLF